MNKDQLQFLLSGILFGFLVGYIIAYAVHEPRVVQSATPVPAAGNLGMSGAGGATSAGQPAAPEGGTASGPGGEQMMAQVFQEVTALKSAIEKNPKDAAALVRLANMYHDAGKYQDAVTYYKKALEIHPEDADVRTDMGICLRELGMSDDALAQFRTSLSYSPKHWQTWLNLGIVALFDKQDLALAGEAFAKVEEYNPNFKDLPLLKEALKKAGAATPRKSS
ncbi:MAG TPA: tetratricopeptide repeat protein [Candidatus Polarisedimenticolia bacterium]|nr:tetratricopeptide repeat protein [Candidatus Polarisedimenticolia bacterium]